MLHTCIIYWLHFFRALKNRVSRNPQHQQTVNIFWNWPKKVCIVTNMNNMILLVFWILCSILPRFSQLSRRIEWMYLSRHVNCMQNNNQNTLAYIYACNAMPCHAMQGNWTETKHNTQQQQRQQWNHASHYTDLHKDKHSLACHAERANIRKFATLPNVWINTWNPHNVRANCSRSPFVTHAHMHKSFWCERERERDREARWVCVWHICYLEIEYTHTHSYGLLLQLK